MRLAVLKERRPAETRVAAMPETVKKYIGLGPTVAVESGAGLAAGIPDIAFVEGGADIAPDARAVWALMTDGETYRKPPARGNGGGRETSPA